MWTYESDIGSLVLESEYSNPKSEDSHPEYECSASFIKASNTGDNSIMSQLLHYPIYEPISYPTMNQLNLEGPFLWNWGDDECKYAQIVPRPQTESSNSPKMAKR